MFKVLCNVYSTERPKATRDRLHICQNAQVDRECSSQGRTQKERAIDDIPASFPDVVKIGSQIKTQTALDAFTERPDLISRGEPFAFSLGGWSFNALLVLY